MRANLLPRFRETVAIFGRDLDADHLRQAAAGLMLVAFIAALGVAIESLRLTRINDAAASVESILAERAPERDDAKRLALDVARYQEIAREESTVRRSGSDAAFEVTRIGNEIPERVWLDSLTHDAAGFELVGGSRSVDALSGAILHLGNALPDRPATLVSIDNRDPSFDGVRFTARVAAPSAAPESVR